MQAEEKGHIILRDGNYYEWEAKTKRRLMSKGVYYVYNKLVIAPEDCNSEEERKAQLATNLLAKNTQLTMAAEKNDLDRLIQDKEPLEVGEKRNKLMTNRLQQDEKTFVSMVITVCDAQNTARINGLDDPSFVWNRLAARHKMQTNQNINNLLAEIRSRHQDDSTMQDYLTQQRFTYDAYLMAGGEMDEHTFCLMVIANIAEEFDVQAGLLSASPQLHWLGMEVTLNTASDLLRQRQEHRSKRQQRAKPTPSGGVDRDIDKEIERAVARALASTKIKKKGVCFYYAKHGRCKWGEGCKFRHEKSSKKAAKTKSKTEKAHGDSSSSGSDSEN
jgi:hypothetical protein